MTWNQGNDEDRENSGEQPTPSWTTDGWQQPGENRSDSGAHDGTEAEGQQPNFGVPQEPQQPDFGAPQEQPQVNAGWQPPAPQQPNAGWQAPDQQQWQGQQPNFGGPQANFGAPQPNFGQPQPNDGAPQPNFGEPQPNLGVPQPNFGEPQPNFGDPQPNFGEPQQPAAPNAGWQPPAAPQEPQWNGGYSNFNAAQDAENTGQESPEPTDASHDANENFAEQQPAADAPKPAWGNWAGPEEPSVEHEAVQAPIGEDAQSTNDGGPDAHGESEAQSGDSTTADENTTHSWDSYGPPTEMLDTTQAQTAGEQTEASAESTENAPTSAFGAWSNQQPQDAAGNDPQQGESAQGNEPNAAFGAWPNSGDASASDSSSQEQPTEAFGDSAFSAPAQSNESAADENQSSGWGAAAAAGGAAAAGAGAWAAANQPWQQGQDAPQGEGQWAQPQDAQQGGNQWGQSQDDSQGANQWGQNTDGSQDTHQWSQEPNAGQAAPPQSWQEASQGDAPTQTFGAPPAAFPGDQHVPFQNAQPHPGGGGPGGPGGEGPGGPGGFVPANANADKKAPWYKKKSYLIIAIVLVVLIIAAAVIIPLVIHQRNVDRGDNLAATFNNALEEYNSTWNEENLAAVSAVNLTDPISAANRTWYDLNQENREALDQACADIQPAMDKRNELADTTVPELPQEDAAEASEAYKQAQQDAEAVATQRTSAEDFLTGSETALNEMSEFCGNYGAYADLYDTYEENLAGVMEDAYSVPEGDRIDTSDGAVYYLCESADGCANLYDPDTREQFASAMETTYVGYYQGLADLYSTQCFMAAFAEACAVGATDYQAAADAYQAIVDHLRDTEPTVEVGETLYPELDTLGPAASDAEVAADTSFITEWQKVEPSAFSMNTTGTSLGTLFADKIESIQELATTALGS